MRYSYRIPRPGIVCLVGLVISLVPGTLGCGGDRPQSAQPAAAPSAPAPDTTVNRDDEMDVIEVHKKFVRAFENADREGVAALLDPGPNLLIFHPFVENRFDGIEETLNGLSRMFTRLGKSSWTDVHPMVQVRGDVAWLTYHVLLKSARLPSPFVGRGTEIWIRTANGWKLTHGHWSEHAELAGADRDI